MSKKADIKTWKDRLKKVPGKYVSYKKDGIAALDEAKAERKVLAPLIFTVLLYLSCVFLIGAHYRGVDFFISHTESFLNDIGLLQYISVFSVGSSLLLGLILFLVLFIDYVFTRFVCVKLFSRGISGKKVLLDSIIEFGMNSIPLIIFFLIGGVLSDLVWWSFYPLMAFFALFFIIMLIRSIFDAVDRKKQTSLMVFVMTVFIFISLLLINAFMIAVIGYSLITVAQGVYDKIVSIIDGIKSWLEGVFGSFS